MYRVTNNEHSDSKKSDIIYTPTCKITESMPPITVEVQQLIDWSFMRRLNRYCLNICDKYKVMPKVVVFGIKGFSSKQFMKEFDLKDSYYTMETKIWAESLRIYCIDSIASEIDFEKPLSPMVALSHFLCSQEKSIISLDLCDDTEMRKLYILANKIFEKNHMEEVSATDIALDSLQKTENQFLKIKKYAESGDLSQVKKIAKYAANGVEYVGKKRKLLEGNERESDVVTPIEVEESVDLNYVKKFIGGLNGQKMNWKKCYEQGQEDKLFLLYSSFLSLKGAYHKKRL